MSLFFKAQEECDYFLFFDPKEKNNIVLPEALKLGDFLSLIQSSLDQLRPVVILHSEEVKKEIDLNSLKSFHFKNLAQKFIFLNYSIRNSLSKMPHSDQTVKSFEQIEQFFVKNFLK